MAATHGPAGPASLHTETADACTITSWAANNMLPVSFSQHLQAWAGMMPRSIEIAKKC